MNDSYAASAHAYEFLMKSYATVFHVKQEDALPLAITKATAFMDNNYPGSISLDDVVAVSGLSKYH